MITPKMLEFVEKNVTHKIVFGERRTRLNKPALKTSDLVNSNLMHYRFDDGTIITLTSNVIKSAPDFLPDWGL